ncbi:MAG: hypothetical protein KatS3mg104_3065 [Phycisphaerae bacterium]|nr:MAG: hypothetical protein KatS3mg104_3065 [Phycisphaerae bacterium]
MKERVDKIKSELDQLVSLYDNLHADYEKLVRNSEEFVQRISFLESEISRLQSLITAMSGVTPERKKLTVDKTITVSSNREISGVELVYGGADPMIRVLDGGRLVLRDVIVTGSIKNFLIADAMNYSIELDGVTVSDTEKYGVYCGCRKMFGSISGKVVLKNCSFGSSTWETPIRFMPGVAVDLYKTTAISTKNTTKSMPGARFHCETVIADSCHFGNWTRIHPSSDGKNNPDERLKLAVFRNCVFDGGVRLAPGILGIFFEGCTFDATKNSLGWALSKKVEGVVPDVKTDFVAKSCVFIGKVDRSLGKFLDCEFR